MNWVALLAGLFSGIVGSMGLGGGAVLVIYLSLFTENGQLMNQGINLLFFIPIGAAAVTVYAIKKQIQWKTVITTALWGLGGTLLGIEFSEIFGGEITAKIFGGLLIFIGLWEIFGKKEKKVDKKNDG